MRTVWKYDTAGGSAYLHRTSCQAAECTWRDTCIWGRSPCPRRCAGSLRCRGYRSLPGKEHAKGANNQTGVSEGVLPSLRLHSSALTDAVPLVHGQFEPRTALAGHAPFGTLLADVGAAVLLIHTVEALWDRERRTMKLSRGDRPVKHKGTHTERLVRHPQRNTRKVLTPFKIQKHPPACCFSQLYGERERERELRGRVIFSNHN